MMQVETVDDLVEQLADWFGIYGGCKTRDDATSCESKCDFDPKKPFCCRIGFSDHMTTRIENAVENTRKIEEHFSNIIK